jgi:predicted aspartyl protease
MRLLLIGILVVNVGLVGHATAQPNLPGYAAVQMTRGPQNHLIMAARVNGQPVRLLVDTGADISFLRRDRAAALGVTPTGETIRRRGRTFPLATINDFGVADASLGGTTVGLSDAAQLRGTAPGPGGAVDGLIGLDLLRRHNAVINCRTRQLFLKVSPGPLLDIAKATAGLGFTRVALDDLRRRDLTVPVTIQGRPGRLVVDTGAFVTGLDDDTMRAFGVPMRPTALTTRGLDGKVRPVALADIQEFRIGSVAIEPQPFAVMDLYGKRKPLRTHTGLGRLEFYGPRNPRERVLGLLGNELLDQRRAIIDLGSGSLFLK